MKRKIGKGYRRQKSLVLFEGVARIERGSTAKIKSVCMDQEEPMEIGEVVKAGVKR